MDAPSDADEWQTVQGQMEGLIEPEFVLDSGNNPASGVVIVEPEAGSGFPRQPIYLAAMPIPSPRALHQIPLAFNRMPLKPAMIKPDLRW